MIKYESSGCTFVLLGNFQPAIFQPKWLATKGLFSESEAEIAEIFAISKNLSIFSVAYIKFECFDNRLVISTPYENRFEVARDLVVGLISLLPDMIVDKLGINFDAQLTDSAKEIDFDLSSAVLKDKLAYESRDTEAYELTMRYPPIVKYGAYQQLSIKRSEQYVKTVLVTINNHFDLDQQESPGFTLDNVLENWDELYSNSKKIYEHYYKILFPKS